METRTYYFPANRIGRHILNYLVAHVGCSISSIRKIADNLAVVITTQECDVTKVEHILRMYDLM